MKGVHNFMNVFYSFVFGINVALYQTACDLSWSTELIYSLNQSVQLQSVGFTVLYLVCMSVRMHIPTKNFQLNAEEIPKNFVVNAETSQKLPQYGPSETSIRVVPSARTD